MLRLLVAILLILLLLLLLPVRARAATPWQVFKTVNAVRHQHGLNRVYVCPGLRTIARNHSRDMLRHRYFSHTGSRGATFRARILRSRFTRRGTWWAGETLAWTSSRTSSWRLLSLWMHSAPHRAVILSPQARCVGIGRAVGTYHGYSGANLWTADWGQH